MFEHPYLTQQVTAFEQEQLERAVARRRMLVEHADQIVPRQAGTMRRMLRRLTGRASGVPAVPAVAAPACAGPVTAR